MVQDSLDTCDIELPGYHLTRRIGSGGYGEVWLAEAPGGLTKAVKVVYGYHNENRAARELHSLEKIKSVRHPFLLSLESIQVVDGRLVIVTELADGSLRDRFDECCREGLPGIPRPELLGYLRDAADALDYLRDKHGLQHLDIKPENLLLVGAHVKVADFGLVKEVSKAEVSMVGGLTPTYSAPEVFQGNPSIHSDQYSLAVLYQQMLTGQLPFTGQSAAELTLQHMHDDADLTSLPPTDRYVIARSLSKAPHQRYASSSALLEGLFQCERSAQTWDSPPSPSTMAENGSTISHSAGAQSQAVTRTMLFDDLAAEEGEGHNALLIDVPPVEPSSAQRLPPVDFGGSDFHPTPSVVLGIGGTAGTVLQQLRRRLAARFGHSGRIPAVQFLLLDTDRNALARLARGDKEISLDREETLALPLRRPQEYREASSRMLKWISRRWLYNIPKSLLAEGLRPLGRLAFVDNARRCVQRIRNSLALATDTESILGSQESTTLPFKPDAIRVYVVAGVSGGTGSGMSLDVGFATKTLLEKMGIPDSSILGVFLHSTGTGSRFRDLAKVNAHAWLTELNHYQNSTGQYPGDDACGLPAHDVGQKAFDHTYFVHLGDNLDEEELAAAARSVSDFLYLDMLTPAQRFFERSRETTNNPDSPWAELRSVAVHNNSPLNRQDLDRLAQELSCEVIRTWCGTSLESETASATVNDPTNDGTRTDTNHVVCGTAAVIAQLQISTDGLAAHARSQIERQFGNNPEEVLEKLIQRLDQSGKPATPAEVIRLVTEFFSPPAGAESHDCIYVLQRPLDVVLRPLAMRLCDLLQQWLLNRLNSPQERVDGALRACNWFVRHFERVNCSAAQLAQTLQRQVAQTAEEFAAPHSPATGKVANQDALGVAIRYYRLRLDYSAAYATRHLVDAIQAKLRVVQESLVEFGRHLRNLAERLAAELQATAGNAGVSQAYGGIAGVVKQRFGELARSVDTELQEHFLAERGGLFEAVMSNNREFTELLGTLNHVCQRHVDAAVTELAANASPSAPHARHAPQEGHDGRGEERIKLLEYGGIGNELAIVPQHALSEAAADRCRTMYGSNSSLIALDGEDSILCCEAGDIPLPQVAFQLIDRRRDFYEYAARVQSRTDVPWKSLLAQQNAVSMNTCQMHTQVLSNDSTVVQSS